MSLHKLPQRLKRLEQMYSHRALGNIQLLSDLFVAQPAAVMQFKDLTPLGRKLSHSKVGEIRVVLKSEIGLYLRLICLDSAPPVCIAQGPLSVCPLQVVPDEVSCDLEKQRADGQTRIDIRSLLPELDKDILGNLFGNGRLPA